MKSRFLLDNIRETVARASGMFFLHPLFDLGIHPEDLGIL